MIYECVVLNIHHQFRIYSINQTKSQIKSKGEHHYSNSRSLNGKGKQKKHSCYYRYMLKKIENLKGGSKHLQDRPLTKPLDLSIHLTSKHQSKHL